MIITHFKRCQMKTPNKLIEKKLCKLSSFLHHASNEFEKAAGHATAEDIKMSIRTVETITKQYMKELQSQLAILRIKCVIRDNKREERNVQPNKAISDREIIKRCCNSEEYFEKAYRIILNQYFPYSSLRQMLVYQLNEIKHSFMQLRLLKSVLSLKATYGNVLF